MGDSDRLKRLRELRKALDADPLGAGAAQASEDESSPEIGARPSAAAPLAPSEPPGSLAAPPAPPVGLVAPGALDLPEAFPAAPAPASPPSVERPAASFGPPRPPQPLGGLGGPSEIRPPLPGTVPGTAAELPAGTRGPEVLAFLEGALSPIAALETWHLLAASGILFVLGSLIALQMLQEGEGARVLSLPLGGLLLPPALRALSTALFRALIIPGIRVRLAGLQWSTRQRRAQVEVSVSGDTPLTGNWRRAIRVSLGASSPPAKPLSVRMVSYDAGSKLDLAFLMEAPTHAVDAAIVRVTCPDGREIGLDAPIQRWREAKCGRCRGEDPACALCAGTNEVQEAMF